MERLLKMYFNEYQMFVKYISSKQPVFGAFMKRLKPFKDIIGGNTCCPLFFQQVT